jgi:hypothetical protein
LVLSDDANEQATRSERSYIASHIASSPDYNFRAASRKDQCRRFRGNAGHLTIDELVHHEISDA